MCMGILNQTKSPDICIQVFIGKCITFEVYVSVTKDAVMYMQ